jgi:hypothetical protein
VYLTHLYIHIYRERGREEEGGIGEGGVYFFNLVPSKKYKAIRHVSKR